MFCPICGAEIGENDNNCAQCGATLKSTEPINENVAEPVVEAVNEDIKEPVVESANEAVNEPVFEPVAEQHQEQGYYAQPDYQQQSYQQPNPNYQQPGYQQQNYQPNFQDPYFNPIPQFPVEDPGKNLGIASLVLAIVGMVTCCCPIASALSAISPVCLIVGIVLGFIARSKSKSVNIKNKLGLAGIIISFVPIVLFIAAVAIVTAAIFATDGAIFEEIIRALEEAGMGDYSYMFEDMLGEFENMI